MEKYINQILFQGSINTIEHIEPECVGEGFFIRVVQMKGTDDYCVTIPQFLCWVEGKIARFIYKNANCGDDVIVRGIIEMSDSGRPFIRVNDIEHDAL